MKAKRIALGALGIAAALALLLVAACGGDSKESVIAEMWDCQAENDPAFEESMMLMFPSAEDLDDAKEQYIYISQVVSMDELKASRDYLCGDE